MQQSSDIHLKYWALQESDYSESNRWLAEVLSRSVDAQAPVDAMIPGWFFVVTLSIFAVSPLTSWLSHILRITPTKALELRRPTGVDLVLMELWGPVVVETCQQSMHDSSAPCAKERLGSESNLVVSQELIYPAFKLRLPRFLTPEIRDQFIADVSDADHFLISEDREWALFPSRIGQNLVFENVVFSPDYVNGWVSGACHQTDVSHDWLVHFDSHNDLPEPVYETVILANTGYSHKFQHFLDGVSVVTHQAEMAIDRFVTSGLAIFTDSLF